MTHYIFLFPSTHIRIRFCPHRRPKNTWFFSLNKFYASWSFYGCQRFVAVLMCLMIVGQSRMTFVWFYQFHNNNIRTSRKTGRLSREKLQYHCCEPLPAIHGLLGTPNSACTLNIFSRIILVYYCKCCNLIGYSIRYLFIIRIHPTIVYYKSCILTGYSTVVYS